MYAGRDLVMFFCGIGGGVCLFVVAETMEQQIGSSVVM